jgi:hypothetical protein
MRRGKFANIAKLPEDMPKWTLDDLRRTVRSLVRRGVAASALVAAAVCSGPPLDDPKRRIYQRTIEG